MSHVEAFLRRRLFSVVFVTGSLQWLSRPLGVGPDGIFVTGLRLAASF